MLKTQGDVEQQDCCVCFAEVILLVPGDVPSEPFFPLSLRYKYLLYKPQGQSGSCGNGEIV